MSKISVIIPVYNTEQYLPECLDSVLAQTFTDIEIICINDGSTDNSLKILQKYAKQDSRINVINQKNSGVIVARNNAIATAKSEYIFPLDSDDIITPDCLEKLYTAITSGKGDIITSRVMYFGRENHEMELSKPTRYNMALGNRLVNASLFRKSDFDKTGGYDTDFSLCLEDYDLWLNMMFNLKLKIYRVPEILFYYRLKPIAEARNFQHRSEHAEQMKKFLVKYPQIKKYVLLSKIKKFFRKIRRFFIRKQDNTIKILKIPVCRIRKRGTSLAYWFNDRSNFGDLLNPYLCEFLGRKLSHVNVLAADIIGIGSLMELLFSNRKCKRIKWPLIVYGTGFIKAPDEPLYLKRNLDVRAVRGYNTLARLKGLRGVKIADNVVIGDPGLLAAVLLDGEKITKKYKLGIIPHYVDAQSPLLKKIECKNTKIIDITLDPVSVMKQIAECENIISSAMHGLIAADSLGIPNIRMLISDKIIGGDYKYDDYYSAFGIKKHNRVDLRQTSFTEQDLDDLKNTYQIKPEQVHQKQKELIDAFPYKIKRKICL